MAVPFLLAEPFAAIAGGTTKQVLDLLVGIALGFHYAAHVKQFGFRQTDLKSTGLVVSIGLTYTLVLIILVITVAVVLGDYGRIPDFVTNSFSHAPDHYRSAGSWLQSLRSRL